LKYLHSLKRESHDIAHVEGSRWQGARQETDGPGEVDVPADKLWGARTQRSLEHRSIGADLFSRERQPMSFPLVITSRQALRQRLVQHAFRG
jgi:hypothetical protein